MQPVSGRARSAARRGGHTPACFASRRPTTRVGSSGKNPSGPLPHLPERGHSCSRWEDNSHGFRCVGLCLRPVMYGERTMHDSHVCINGLKGHWSVLAHPNNKPEALIRPNYKITGDEDVCCTCNIYPHMVILRFAPKPHS